MTPKLRTPTLALALLLGASQAAVAAPASGEARAGLLGGLTQLIDGLRQAFTTRAPAPGLGGPGTNASGSGTFVAPPPPVPASTSAASEDAAPTGLMGGLETLVAGLGQLVGIGRPDPAQATVGSPESLEMYGGLGIEPPQPADFGSATYRPPSAGEDPEESEPSPDDAAADPAAAPWTQSASAAGAPGEATGGLPQRDS